MRDVQATGAVERNANLTGNGNATIVWNYHAPPAIDVFVYPADGCADDTTTCNELTARCEPAALGGVVRMQPRQHVCTLLALQKLHIACLI